MNTNRAVRYLIFAVLMLSLSAASFAEVAVGIAVRFGPPAIPVYAQPICPGPGYIWTPGYWAWNDDDGYYWVPGTWVLAPVGMLWTPGYWGWSAGFYHWHPGYWGPHVGFYGGINYGFGYTGVGFWGGEWRGNRFFYNRSVTNINVVNVTNVYQRNVVVNNHSRVSYNGGSGGLRARPTANEERYAREPRREAFGAQREHEHAAGRDRQMFASQNHGRPAVAATGRPGEFRGHDVVGARAAGEPYRTPKISPQRARVSPSEARGVEPRNQNREIARPMNRNEGNREVFRNPRQQAQQDRAAERQRQQQAQQEQRAERQRQQQVQMDRANQRREQEQARQDQRRLQEAARVEQRRPQQEPRQQQKADRSRPQQEQKRPEPRH